MSLTLSASCSRDMGPPGVRDFDDCLYLPGPDVAIGHRSLSISRYGESPGGAQPGGDGGMLPAAVGAAAVGRAGRADRTPAEGAGRSRAVRHACVTWARISA